MLSKHICPLKKDWIILSREVFGRVEKNVTEKQLAEKLLLKRHSMCLERDFQNVLLSQAA